MKLSWPISGYYTDIHLDKLGKIMNHLRHEGRVTGRGSERVLPEYEEEEEEEEVVTTTPRHLIIFSDLG
jgi:hypothetical protein